MIAITKNHIGVNFKETQFRNLEIVFFTTGEYVLEL
jgi:hypothetical protein